VTSRERVLMAISRKEPDRVPLGFGIGLVGSSMVESIPNGRVYSDLCRYLDYEDRPEPIISEFGNIVGNIDERILKKFGADFRSISPDILPPRMEADGSKTWDIMCGYKINRMGYYDEPYPFPFKNLTTKKDIENYNWPNPDDFDIAKGKREEARVMHETTDYAIIATSWFKLFPFNGYAQLSGLDKWLMDMKLNPEFYFALADKFLEYGQTMDGKFLEAVGDYVDIVGMFDDLGGQNGLLMSHADYVKFIKPYNKQVIQGIKKYTDAKIVMHCCGSIYDVIPDLAEIGVDVINPLQPLARNMESWRLKKDFGKIISFWGGIDIQELLPRGTIKQVKEGVKRTIDTYAPGGGYILGTAHNIEPDTSPENIVAMLEATLEYGHY